MGADQVILGSDWPHMEGLAEPRDLLDELDGVALGRPGEDPLHQRQGAQRTAGGMTGSASEAEPVLLTETGDGVRMLTLNRPAKKNALSGDLVEALVEAVAAAAVDDDVRVVGLTGAGDAFCAGADLGASGRADDLETTTERVIRLVRGMRVECEKPIVAGIGGVAIGAGLSLALCADLRVASSAARFHPGYARLGTSPDVGLSWTLPQAVGREQALRFLLQPEIRERRDRAGHRPRR